MSYAIWTRFRIRSFAEAKKIRNALSESWEKMKAIDPMLRQIQKKELFFDDTHSTFSYENIS